MTAKEALRERIDSLTEDEAAELLEPLQWESSDEETPTPEQVELFLAGEAEFEAGEFVDGEAFLPALALSRES
ncbi:MAG: hypothetical protein ABI939_07440 [Anaerolineaceae bacterium]